MQPEILSIEETGLLGGKWQAKQHKTEERVHDFRASKEKDQAAHFLRTTNLNPFQLC